MKIEILVQRASLSGGDMPGDVIDVPKNEADRLIAAGHAKLVRRPKQERAVHDDLSEKAER